MANFFEAPTGEDITLSFNNILNDGSISVTAKIYNIANTQIGSTETLAHVADGLYTVRYTVPDPVVGDALTVFYIPTGDDNSNSIDQIKVRALSPFGHGGGGTAAVDITDDDIKAIAEAVSKMIEPEKPVDILKQKLPNGKTLEQTLIEKTEIKKDVVVSSNDNVEKAVKNVADSLAVKLSKEINTSNQSNIQLLSAITEQLSGINISVLTQELKQIKQLLLSSNQNSQKQSSDLVAFKKELTESLLNLDEIQLVRLNKLLKSVDDKFKILQISQMPELANKIKF